MKYKPKDQVKYEHPESHEVAYAVVHAVSDDGITIQHSKNNTINITCVQPSTLTFMQRHYKDGTIRLSAEIFDNLTERDDILSALEAGGVDSWTWYDESISAYFGNED